VKPAGVDRHVLDDAVQLAVGEVGPDLDQVAEPALVAQHELVGRLGLEVVGDGLDGFGHRARSRDQAVGRAGVRAGLHTGDRGDRRAQAGGTVGRDRGQQVVAGVGDQRSGELQRQVAR
jgi:hypothetical protein